MSTTHPGVREDVFDVFDVFSWRHGIRENIGETMRMRLDMGLHADRTTLVLRMQLGSP
jgi:hypothetical protein